MNLSMKRTQRHEGQICGCREEGGEGGIKRGFEKSRCKAIIFRMNKPQGPGVEHRDILQYPVINHNGKDYEKEYIYGTQICMYMKPPCRAAESNTTL